MKILVVLAHPNPKSFNAAIAQIVLRTLQAGGHEVIFHDLYAENFDPVLKAAEMGKDAVLPLEIQQYCRELALAQGIIIIHPNWWGQPPALLKGWVDRVFRPEVAYRFLEGDSGEGVPEGLLRAEAALVFTTSNTAPLRELEYFGDPLQNIWQNCIFRLCGISRFLRQNFAIVVTSTPEQRQEWLQQVTTIVEAFFPKV